MINEQTLRGNWNQIAGKIRKKWGEVTKDDLEKAQGDVDQLIGLIQRKTGEARGAIEEFFDEMSEGTASAIGNAAENVRQYAHDASETVRDTARHAADSVREGYAQAEDMVRQRPTESVAVCFGAGMLLGVLLGLTIRPR
jgi:uncharacterized protein YjbJ (UPF0337 family)